MGAPAIDRAGLLSGSNTIVSADNPANDTGTITSVEIWASSTLNDVEVATFFLVSGTNYTTRGTHTIGTVTGGSKQTFSGLEIPVQAGDLIGMFWPSPAGQQLEIDFDGFAGRYYKAGDHIPCTNETFTLLGGDAFSIYGIGTTEVEEEEVNVINMGINF